jgi:hypothetical protein
MKSLASLFMSIAMMSDPQRIAAGIARGPS